MNERPAAIPADLELDGRLVDQAREDARAIAREVLDHVREHTTTSMERTALRLAGIDGVDAEGTPLPNLLVEQMGAGLGYGAAYWLFNAVAATGLDPMAVAGAVAEGRIDLARVPSAPPGRVRELGRAAARAAVAAVDARRQERDALVGRLGNPPSPWLYVIVATGNIYEDVVQARSAARMGADVIAVIRSTGQSLLDYVPYGPTVEGYAGTYATQANFRVMREALDGVSQEVGRYIRQVNYASGLCMPEIATMGAIERLDMMLNDAMYGILFRDINPRRTLIDQYLSRRISARAGHIINTGEDNYLTTDDAYEAAHTVIASQFINEQFALSAGLKPEQIGLGHAFQMDPEMTGGLLAEIAQAALVRALFPGCPIKFMPPTKYKTGNIFRAHLQDALFNLVGVMTGQGIQLLGMPTEALHTPFVGDRYLALENARYVMNNARGLGQELALRPGGRIGRRAGEVLERAAGLLGEIRYLGLWEALEQGFFAGVRRDREGGKGREGVVLREADYFNPFLEALEGGGGDG
ncbi:MAG TPA: lysine 5,6-aminomutase subunit alpha [Bacillota bacterium]|nr:lysine 5,6-aminomutase subunit alpha [Bacillota bacterium]